MAKSRHVHLLDENTDRWIISYADFITLLFAFFVVMYAVSTINLDKYMTIAKSLQGVFSQEQQQATIPQLVRPVQAVSTETNFANQPLHQLTDRLQFLDPKQGKVSSEKDWVELELNANALFYSGQANLKDNGLQTIENIAQQLKNQALYLAVEGHTDNLPIKTARFPSNWELSAARAATVARILVEKGINPQRLTVLAYGSQFPKADNRQQQGREHNRRVSIIVARDMYAQRMMNPLMSDEIRKFVEMEQYLNSTKQVNIIKEQKTEKGIRIKREVIRVKKDDQSH